MAAVGTLAGCLDGVDEVYGMHNWPTVELGTLLYVQSMQRAVP
jgi:metal-dependent amidase/aminoacylase/carboxypeptidase family protein